MRRQEYENKCSGKIWLKCNNIGPHLHLETRLVQAPQGGRAASFLGFGGSRAMAVARRARRVAGTMVLVQPTMPGLWILGPGTYGPRIRCRFECFLEPPIPFSASYPSLWKCINQSFFYYSNYLSHFLGPLCCMKIAVQFQFVNPGVSHGPEHA